MGAGTGAGVAMLISGTIGGTFLEGLLSAVSFTLFSLEEPGTVVLRDWDRKTPESSCLFLSFIVFAVPALILSSSSLIHIVA